MRPITQLHIVEFFKICESMYLVAKAVCVLEYFGQLRKMGRQHEMYTWNRENVLDLLDEFHRKRWSAPVKLIDNQDERRSFFC